MEGQELLGGGGEYERQEGKKVLSIRAIKKLICRETSPVSVDIWKWSTVCPLRGKGALSLVRIQCNLLQTPSCTLAQDSNALALLRNADTTDTDFSLHCCSKYLPAPLPPVVQLFVVTTHYR